MFVVKRITKKRLILRRLILIALNLKFLFGTHNMFLIENRFYVTAIFNQLNLHNKVEDWLIICAAAVLLL